MTNIHVSTPEELMSALANATGGEIILLAPGSYGLLTLYDTEQPFASFASEVTIRSADPSDPAAFSGVLLNGVDNLSFDSVKLDYRFSAGDLEAMRPFEIKNSHNVTISNSVFDGDLASGTGTDADGFGTAFGVTVIGSSDVTVIGNEFFNWLRAGVYTSVENLVVANNDVHDIRSDGFDFSNVDNVLIESNHLHDFNKLEGSTDHLDMIQFWTNSTTSPSTNIIIRDNFLNSGEGDWTQAIFMRNGLVDTGQAGVEMYYQNVLIENNVIYNSHIHGITVGEAFDVTIANNTILQNHYDGYDSLTFVPTINVASDSKNVQVVDNVVPRLALKAQTGWVVDGNLVVQRDDPAGENFVGDLFVNALADSQATLADLKAVPGGIIEQQGVGSTLTTLATAGSGLVGVVTSVAGTGFDLPVHDFYASHVYGPSGLLGLEAARVSWDFGDGETGSGQVVSHRFAEAGKYEVTAVVELGDGTTVRVARTVEVQSPIALLADFDAGAVDLSNIQNAATVGRNVTFETHAGGKAIRLNGDEISYKGGQELEGNDEYTLLADFKKDAGDPSAAGRLIQFSGSFVLSVEAAGVSATVITDQGTHVLRGANLGIADDDWHRVALTFSGNSGSAVLYVDGKEVDRVDGLAGAVQPVNNQNLHIGNPWGESFPGLVDNVALLRGALAPEDANLSLAAIVDKISSGGTGTGGGGVVSPIAGTAGDDVLFGTDQADEIAALGGNDSVSAAGGDDLIVGGSGAGTDTYDGGAGVDTVTYASTTQGVTANFLSGIATGPEIDADSLVNIENIIGGTGDDRLIGSTGANELIGGEGSDLLDGSGGADRLFGGGQRDSLYGGEGNDVLNGGDGADWMYGGAGDDTYHVDDMYDFIDEGHVFTDLGGGGTDTLYTSAPWYYESSRNAAIENFHIDEAAAGDHTTLVANGGDNVIYGNSGDNNIYVNGGDDWVWAGPGTDHVDLGFVESGTRGANTVSVTPGCDYDVVWQFLPGTDRIDISTFGHSDFSTIVSGNDGLGNSFYGLGGEDTLILVGVGVEDLQTGDFVFSV